MDVICDPRHVKSVKSCHVMTFQNPLVRITSHEQTLILDHVLPTHYDRSTSLDYLMHEVLDHPILPSSVTKLK